MVERCVLHISDVLLKSFPSRIHICSRMVLQHMDPNIEFDLCEKRSYSKNLWAHVLLEAKTNAGGRTLARKHNLNTNRLWAGSIPQLCCLFPIRQTSTIATSIHRHFKVCCQITDRYRMTGLGGLALPISSLASAFTSSTCLPSRPLYDPWGFHRSFFTR